MNETGPMTVRTLPLFKKPLHDKITVEVGDSSGPGGANHKYTIVVDMGKEDSPSRQFSHIYFQKGAVNETGVNGISDECLLAIVKDRLQGFQRGEFSCRENAIALTKLEECVMWLNKRSADRIERGVEGYMKK